MVERVVGMVVMLGIVIKGDGVRTTSAYSLGAPRIIVGPYRPWGSYGTPFPGPSNLQIPLHTVTPAHSLVPDHPGYQTNIVIDPYSKVSWNFGCYDSNYNQLEKPKKKYGTTTHFD